MASSTCKRGPGLKPKQSNFDPTIQKYLEFRIERRLLLKGLLYTTAATVANGSVLSMLGCSGTQPAPTAVSTPTSVPAASPTVQGTPTSPLSVAEGDPAIETSTVTFPGERAPITAYQARPRGTGAFPALLICHENRGLTDHIRDVTRRFAKEGYTGLALDLLSREGGTDKVEDPNQIPEMLTRIPPERNVADFEAGYRHLLTLPDVLKDRIGMIGYCFGGGVTWRAVTQIAGLKAAAAYYGPAPPLEDVPKIKAAVFGVYAENDPRINLGKEPLEAALKQHNKTYRIKVYPGVEHAFFNDTGTRYNEPQSLAVWKDTLDWFTRYLKA